MGINQSIFGNIHTYKWTFTINNNYSLISCTAYSIDEARAQILKLFKDLDEVDEQFPRINEMSILYLENEEFEKENERVQQREYQYQLALKEKTKYVENFPIYKYRSTTVIDSRDFMTLGDFINITEPIIDTVKQITFIG